jgi:hypothetical protein
MSCFLNYALKYAVKEVQENHGCWSLKEYISFWLCLPRFVITVIQQQQSHLNYCNTARRWKLWKEYVAKILGHET